MTYIALPTLSGRSLYNIHLDVDFVFCCRRAEQTFIVFPLWISDYFAVDINVHYSYTITTKLQRGTVILDRFSQYAVVINFEMSATITLICMKQNFRQWIQDVCGFERPIIINKLYKVWIIHICNMPKKKHSYFISSWENICTSRFSL